MKVVEKEKKHLYFEYVTLQMIKWYEEVFPEKMNNNITASKAILLYSLVCGLKPPHLRRDDSPLYYLIGQLVAHGQGPMCYDILTDFLGRIDVKKNSFSNPYKNIIFSAARNSVMPASLNEEILLSQLDKNVISILDNNINIIKKSFPNLILAPSIFISDYLVKMASYKAAEKSLYKIGEVYMSIINKNMFGIEMQKDILILLNDFSLNEN